MAVLRPARRAQRTGGFMETIRTILSPVAHVWRWIAAAITVVTTIVAIVAAVTGKQQNSKLIAAGLFFASLLIIAQYREIHALRGSHGRAPNVNKAQTYVSRQIAHGEDLLAQLRNGGLSHHQNFLD